MADLLVKLYDLEPCYEEVKSLEERGILVKRPIAPERESVVSWVREHFGKYWASECEVAFSRVPVSCYVAVKEGEILGFACYDVTSKGFFGPTGVIEASRGLGLGKVLLMKSMDGLRDLGYGYAFIGDAGPVDFYKKLLGALEIPDSYPGVYKGFIK